MKVWLVLHKIMHDDEKAFPSRYRIQITTVVGIFSSQEQAEAADQNVRQHAIDPAGHFRMSEISLIHVDDVEPLILAG